MPDLKPGDCTCFGPRLRVEGHDRRCPWWGIPLLEREPVIEFSLGDEPPMPEKLLSAEEEAAAARSMKRIVDESFEFYTEYVPGMGDVLMARSKERRTRPRRTQAEQDEIDQQVTERYEDDARREALRKLEERRNGR